MIASEHLQPHQIDAFADHELSPDEARVLQQHLATCHACSLRVLSTINLKQATAAAGRRFDLDWPLYRRARRSRLAVRADGPEDLLPCLLSAYVPSPGGSGSSVGP